MNAAMIHVGDGIELPERDGRPYLGEVAVVSGLVHNFVTGVMQARHAFAAGTATREASLQDIEDWCFEMGHIFLGEDPSYQPAPWNGPRLAGRIRALIPGVRGEEHAGVEYFRWLAKQVLALCTAMEGGMADQEAGPIVKQGMLEAVQFLTGVTP
jgi:hypothetical protein